MTTAASERIVLVLQTIVSLPFGPLAIEKSTRQSELMAKARAVIVISNFMKQYIDTYGKIQSHLMHLPVYGEGPFPKLARRDNRFVTMINPCEIKGAPIFLALARQFSDVQFAAVPTWGADRQLLDDLTDLPNVFLLEPTDDIDQILAQTRVLLAPSLWPESFGYVVPEAMLRGVPVLASNIGGLPEAKLGVEYLIPVLPAFRNGNGYVCPPQDIAPWSSALGKLLADPDLYARCSYASREAALSFVARIDTRRFERFLCELG